MSSWHLLWLVCISTLFGQAPQEMQPLVKPDLSLLRTAIRENIEIRTTRLELMFSSSDGKERASAYGQLAQLYQAHAFRKEALVAYQNAALSDPEDQLWPYYLATVHMEMGNLAQAAESLRGLLELAPHNYHANVRLGHVLLEMNQLEAAAACLTKAIQLNPKSALALFGMGQITSLQKQHQKAVDYFERALAEQPEATKINYPLGLAYRRLGNREKARFFLTKRGTGIIVFPDPYLAEIHGLQTMSSLYVVLSMAAADQGFSAQEFEAYLLANLLEKKGVIAYLQDALSYKASGQTTATQEELARLHFAIAVFKLQQSAWDSARISLEKALDLNPTFTAAMLKLGELYASAGAHELKGAVYERALAIDPQNLDLLSKHVLAMLDLNRISDACDSLRKWIALAPELAEPRLRLATLIEKTDPQGALEQYRKLVNLEMGNRELAIVHGNLAMLMQNKGDSQVAIDNLELSLKLNPDLLQSRINLAAILGFLNRFEEAATQYAEVVARDPNHEQARFGELAALVLGRQYAKALTRMEAGLKTMPDNIRMKHLLARMLAAAPDSNLRDGKRALELASLVFKQRQTHAHAETYAMAMAQSERFEDAVALLNQLIANTEGDADRLSWLNANLERYQNRQSCCTDYPPAVILPP